MSARNQTTTQAGRSGQSIMFVQGEDLPLFTGQAPAAVVRPFIPQETVTQPSPIDLRPTLKGADAKPQHKKPGRS